MFFGDIRTYIHTSYVPCRGGQYPGGSSLFTSCDCHVPHLWAAHSFGMLNHTFAIQTTGKKSGDPGLETGLLGEYHCWKSRLAGTCLLGNLGPL